jgi:hypothetical protein
MMDQMIASARSVGLPPPLAAALSGQQEKFVAALYVRDGVVTREAMLEALYDDPERAALLRRSTPGCRHPKNLDVIACHARARARRFGIEIETVRACGWQMTDDGRAAIDGMWRAPG